MLDATLRYARHVFGRLVRACGDSVEMLFTRRVPNPEIIDDRSDQEAFFGLAPLSMGFWAISPWAIYRFDGDEAPVRTTLPEPERVGDVHMITKLPGVIVVYTEIGRRNSVSGFSPLLIARE